MTKEDLDKTFELESIGINEGLFQIKGAIIDKQDLHDIEIKGEIYRSNIQALIDSNANPFVVIPDDSVNNNIEIFININRRKCL